MLQPAAGGPAAAGDHFFADDGSPYRAQINISRQDGNPQRVAGDPRPGATNIITGAEASPHLLDAFKSDTRWELGFDRGADRRYGTVQTFSIDSVSLTQTALSKAVDAIHGRRAEGSSPGNQITRFGGDLVGLDNGNFVVMVEDRSKLLHADGNASVFAIIAPDGTIVTESTLVAPGDQWANLAAFRGGFAVRTRGIIYFFNNSGELLGQISGTATSGVSFDAGRGDGTRMGGHINSPYVYLAGAANVLDNEGNKVPGIYVAAFDSRDQSFVARFKVDNFPNARDRTVVAADALNRVTVAFASKPEGYSGNQIVARVLQFDGCAKEFSALTEPFLAFHNNGTTGFLTTTPSIAVTTKQILVAGKGLINLENDVDAGPNSPAQTTVYAVINHPDPQEDPTTPATSTIPASAEANGLTRIVPDKVIFDDPNNPPNLNNWEPYVGILGNSVFLVGANTFAEGVANEQRFGFVMQPVAGGASAVGDHFFADDGAPYRGQINASRRDGNPQRIAGDPRPGAVHVITGAEASPHLYDPFKGNDRWELGFDRGLNRRYGTVQTFEINPSTLQQTMLSKAQDVANGRLTEGSSASDQASRFGGDVLGLDNGNFVVTVEDRTRVRNPGGNAAVFTILSPTGAIVKETTLVANGDLWSNLAAFKGGFAVRVAGIIYFYSNDGELKGQINSRDSGIGFDPGRGDNTRIAGHINSPYVYLAGNAPVITPAGNVDPGVRVAVFDSRNQSFVATARVDARNGSNDRVVIAVDPLDRFVVAYGN
ncbi:MAG: hypothetical protein FJ405_01565, partial [Verrucomicrobia bacterium]|nr:hypothetical protein [Verrucomicrobiota bacterium]